MKRSENDNFNIWSLCGSESCSVACFSILVWWVTRGILSIKVPEGMGYIGLSRSYFLLILSSTKGAGKDMFK